MKEILTVILDGCDWLGAGVFILLYYASIKKCFLKQKHHKWVLFLVTLFTNPLIVYLSSLIFFTILIGIPAYLLNITDLMDTSKVSTLLFYSTFDTAAFLGMIFLFSYLVGKWLRAPNKALVAFVNLIYGVISMLTWRKRLDQDETELEWGIFAEMIGNIIQMVALILLYRYVIKGIAKLTDKRWKINAKLFVIPPLIFCMLYSELLQGPMDRMSKNERALVFIFSYIIIFLFIWAFSVITQNIIATNEAIEAKDRAAELAKTEARIEADLSAAKMIQSSTLPNRFPAFPDRKEFELFASMNPAKEVGGDFYDYYMLNDRTLGFLIADVSGKSIPGAMFMMTAKTIIKSLAESGLPPAEVFTQANEKLCEGNEAEMFVTAWLGYLDLKTGLVRVANAGHNPPVLIRDGKSNQVILKPGLMLAGMEGIRYREQTVQMQKGDILFLYTDGVTEAMDQNEALYGEERLGKMLSFGEDYPAPAAENGTAESVCKLISADLSNYTDGTEQSDDITMLCIRYLGGA